ncbi:MAG: hypothetical protein EXS35_05775 [Pedosphaera sp.]|nr:hypothetical protein [Pedosphaera sp.]
MGNRVLEHFRSKTPPAILKIADDVWVNRIEFIRWPQKAHLLITSCVRESGSFHTFTPELKSLLKSKGVKINTLCNGPAIMVFLFAGGERPNRNNGNGWPIHHIYDGQFPMPPKTSSAKAVSHGDYFTEAAGLVAIHPLADGLASEVPYFAWLLRHEAFEKFGFDPDNVFGGGK